MRVVMATSEVTPWAKTGGLGDVLAALPGALRRIGIDVTLILPGYRQALAASRAAATGWRLSAQVSDAMVDGELYRAALPDGTPVFLIRCDRYFDRDGLYGPPGSDYGDNAARFTFFARAVLAALERLGPPDVLHCHDWQPGLAPAFLRLDAGRYPALATVRTVMTIHNLGYQGRFWGIEWPLLRLDARYFTPPFLEFYGDLNFLKAGLVCADALTTVSPTYAAEICTPEYGFALDGVLRERRAVLTGILNGVDYGEWSPESDPHLPVRYSARDLRGKAACKAALQRELGLAPRADAPLIGVVSRLAEQKGIDLLVAAAPRLLAHGAQVALLGAGDPRYEGPLRALAAASSGAMAAHIGFDAGLAHRIEAGADIFLMPSRYEPCGLNQIYSLRYATTPVVRATGGLQDTIEEYDPIGGTGTGFKFGPYRADALLTAVDRCRAYYRDRRAWRQLQRNGMAQDYSWDRSARTYAALYDSLRGP